MCPGLHGNKTTRYLLKYLLHRFRCRRHFLFQKDFACFIQNAVARPAIAEVHTNRELVSFENHVSIYLNSANLFHCRSPFHCASSTSNIGSVSHPAETGLLISSDKRLPEMWSAGTDLSGLPGDLNGLTQHSARTRFAMLTKLLAANVFLPPSATCGHSDS